MKAATAREKIYKNMDALSCEFDALDSLNEVKKNINVCIVKVVKSIEKGRSYNRLLESQTRHAA